jgi:hypothetical protein
MTWHYIFAKNSHRLLKYQRLTAHIHPATVEDQSQHAHSRHNSRLLARNFRNVLAMKRMTRKTVSNFCRGAQLSETRAILRHKPDCGMF